ncbi:MAG: sulfur carrier protein ThiS [Lachnospiraceae bacterium]|nr:sulfur carrier protein ThiS [Lachnospiraceae bacterium]
MIKINGKIVKVQGMTLSAYLVQEGYQPARLAVECNGEIVPKAAYDTKVLQDGDVLEIVSFVGGG